jgi:hypothetical protein
MQTAILRWLLQLSRLCSVLRRTVAAHQRVSVSFFFHSIFNLPLKEINWITTREWCTRRPNSSPATWYLAVRGNRQCTCEGAASAECCTSNGPVRLFVSPQMVWRYCSFHRPVYINCAGFGVVTPCGLVKIHARFWRTHWLSLLGRFFYLKTEAQFCFQTLVSIYHNTQCHRTK